MQCSQCNFLTFVSLPVVMHRPAEIEANSPTRLPLWPAMLWLGSVVAAIVLLPQLLGFPQAKTPVAAQVKYQMIVWSAAFVFVAFALAMRAATGRRITAVTILIAVATSWLVCGAYLFRLDEGDHSLKLAFGTAILCGIVVAVPYYARHWLKPLSAFAVVGAIGLCLGVMHLKSLPVPASIEYEPMVQTASYRLALTTVADLRGKVIPRGGGLAALSHGYLLVGAEGELMKLQQLPSDSFSVTPLPGRVPMNRAGYDSARKLVKEMEPRFRVTSVLLDTTVSPAQLYVAHHMWNEKDRCLMLRVSTAAVRVDGPPLDSLTWSTLFDSQPCMALTMFMDGNESGGRLAWAPDGGLLLSVGDYGFNGMGIRMYAQDSTTDYGKVMHIGRKGGHEMVSMGHRNMTGLVTDNSGRIWSMEHGPQGGDELNQIRKGGNYGWPYQTYGTNYGKRSWPMVDHAPENAAYVEPELAFVPSIAPSGLIEMKGNRFPKWKGDFIISTMRTRGLYRVRHSETRVRYVEPISIGTRIRDITEGADGTLMLWTDTGLLIRVDVSAVE